MSERERTVLRRTDIAFIFQSFGLIPMLSAADKVVAGLLCQLWAQPYQTYLFRPLAEMWATWADEFEREYAAARHRLDPGLARAGVTLFRELPSTAGRAVLLCTDLHAENILAARRAPWLVIGPKPYVGDPAYDVLQHMLNCEDRLAADPAGLADRMAGAGWARRRSGAAMAVRPQRPGVALLGTHVPGGHPARAVLARRRRPPGAALSYHQLAG